MAKNPAEDQHLIEALQRVSAENDALVNRVAELARANNYLTRASKVKPRLRIVLQARAVAEKLAILHLAGYQTGRYASLAAGIHDRKWYQGRALLQVARLWGNANEGWLTSDPLEIEAAIKVAFEKCERNPDILIARLPQSRALVPTGQLKRRRRQ
jgi:hypothetical protein